MTAIANRPFRIDYLPLGMQHTRGLWNKTTANRTVLCALPVILALGILELAVKNTAFILANCVIALINGTSYLINRIRALFASRMVPSPSPAPAPAQPGVPAPAPAPRRGFSLSDLFRSRSSSAANNNPAPLPNQQFTADELGAFRAAIISATTAEEAALIQLKDEVVYAVWHDRATHAIHIQDAANYHARRPDNLIEVVIDEPGRITSIRVNGAPQAQIPAEFLPRFRESFVKSLELSSTYEARDGSVAARVIRRGLRDIPDYHLDRLARALMAQPRSDFTASFLKNDLTQDAGVDAGGLSRDYMDDLWESLTAGPNTPLRFSRDRGTGLLTPEAQGEGGALTHQENQMYRQMGQVMMYCYLARGLLIGRRFSDALYTMAYALFPLNREEMATPFDRLPEEHKLRKCRAMAAANGEPAASLRLIDLAIRGDRLSPDELREVATYLDVNGDLPDGFVVDAFNPENGEQRTVVRQALVRSILTKPGVGAAYAMAQGMQQMLAVKAPGRNVREIRPLAFSSQIQGSQDRADIAARLENISGNPVVQQKMGWLREWIAAHPDRGGATPEEIQQLIKFVSGNSSLPHGRNIRVEQQNARPFLPVPVAHTCFYQMDLSPHPATYGRHNDHTKDNFIQAVKEIALNATTSYSFA